MPKTTKTETKQSEQTPQTPAKDFVASMAKKGTPRNGRRIEFHFVRRKRKAY